jgi:serine protease Do
MLRTLPFVIIFLAATAFAGPVPTAEQQSIFRARDRVLPAVVHIQPVIKDYYTGELKKQAVIGSGVIFHPDGYVVTNYHVAGRAERIICTLFDKEQVPAIYVGGDPPSDIAVLKLDLSKYEGKIAVAEFGNSDSVAVGQFVMAMGSPLSLSRTVSFGVVSTKDRYFSSEVRLPSGEQTGKYNLWIQTDAAINPGNSGGPLVDMDGRVIGINSRATFFANNIGFAIPINIVKEVANAILKDGEVKRSWIGLHCQALQELENYFGADGGKGVLISSIDPGSPADQAFMKAGDIVLAVDNKPVSARFVEELPAFYKTIANHKPGSEVEFTVVRGDQNYTFKVTTKALGDLQGEDFESREWGFTVKGITRQMQLENQLKDTLGVVVVGVKQVGAADEGGLMRGDVIISVNKVPVTNLGEFVTKYNELVAEDTEKVLLTTRRGSGVRLVVVNTRSNEGAILDD